MSIVCISRGSFLGAKKLAERLAERLGLPVVSRELTIQAAEELGVSEASLDEMETRPPLFFERFSRERESHLLLVRSKLLAQAAAGGFTYHGNAGHLLIPDVPTLLRLRVVAPMPRRIEAVRQLQGCDERHAAAYIRKMDRSRQRWARYLYDVDWQDASIYDLTINLEEIQLAEATDLVCGLLERERFQRTPVHQQTITDLELACRVQLALGMTCSSRLEVTADAGRVQIRGNTVFTQRICEIRDTAGSVAGVLEVDCQISSSEELIGW